MCNTQSLLSTGVHIGDSFQPKYQLGHPEHYYFSLSKKNLAWIKVSPKKGKIENGSTAAHRHELLFCRSLFVWSDELCSRHHDRMDLTSEALFAETSQNIGYITPKIIIFYHQKICCQDQSIRENI